MELLYNVELLHKVRGGSRHGNNVISHPEEKACWIINHIKTDMNSTIERNLKFETESLHDDSPRPLLHLEFHTRLHNNHPFCPQIVSSPGGEEASYGLLVGSPAGRAFIATVHSPTDQQTEYPRRDGLHQVLPSLGIGRPRNRRG